MTITTLMWIFIIFHIKTSTKIQKKKIVKDSMNFLWTQLYIFFKTHTQTNINESLRTFYNKIFMRKTKKTLEKLFVHSQKSIENKFLKAQSEQQTFCLSRAAQSSLKINYFRIFIDFFCCSSILLPFSLWWCMFCSRKCAQNSLPSQHTKNSLKSFARKIKFRLILHNWK